MMKNRQIHVGFSTARRWNPFSALIRWWWSTSYSHVYIRWSTPWGFDEILEASGTSVKMTEANRWAKKQKVVKEYSFDVDKSTFHQLMVEVRPLTGLPYGWSQALGMAIAELFKLDRNPVDSGSDTFVCSELVAKALTALKIDVKLDLDLVSPADLMDILDAYKENNP